MEESMEILYDFQKATYRKKVEIIKKNMEGTGILLSFFEDRDSAVKYLFSHIPKDAIIGFGGSTTLKELGIIKKLQNEYKNLLDRYKPGITNEEKRELEKKAIFADVFLSSLNAITLKGEIYNVDMRGNRVAPMFFGPKKVFLIAGVNKIVSNIEEARERVFFHTAPINVKRLGYEELPCAKNGICISRCRKKESICAVEVIIYTSPIPNRIEVILINELLGF
jgi:hypothetical protein